MAFKLIVMIAGMVSLTYSKPVMVSFGTRQAPIVPPTPSSTTVNPLAPRNAAPVYENVDDVPNTNQYRPPTPHQYRKQIYSFKPNPNLILGTPLDIKYTPSLQKHDLYNKKAQYAKSVGFDYRGPQQFDIQDYEIEREKKKTLRDNNQQTATQHFVKQYETNRPNNVQNNQQKQPINQSQQRVDYQVREPQSQNYQYNYNYNNNQGNQQQQQNNRYVPGIGIIYSSGLRYYVPQIYYYDNESENSVYDKNEPKYVYQQPQRN